MSSRGARKACCLHQRSRVARPTFGVLSSFLESNRPLFLLENVWVAEFGGLSKTKIAGMHHARIQPERKGILIRCYSSSLNSKCKLGFNLEHIHLIAIPSAFSSKESAIKKRANLQIRLGEACLRGGWHSGGRDDSNLRCTLL